MEKIASELIKIAKTLISNDNTLKRFGELSKEYDKTSDRFRLKEIYEEVTKMKKDFVKEYINFIVEYLKKEVKDPTMVFLGSLDMNIDDKAGNEFIGNTLRGGFISRFNEISEDKIKSLKPLYKKAFDIAYGEGTWEKAVENNKKK